MKVKVMLLALLIFISVGSLMGQAQEKTVATSQQKEIYYTETTATPLSEIPLATEAPMTVDELSCVEKRDTFTPIRDCPWSKKLQKKIKKICRKYSISFELIMSMAYTESRFNKTAVGDEGEAYGAWQIHPDVWRAVIHKLGYKNSDMLRAVPAAEVTCYIMRAHFKAWDDVYYALMAWNGGGAYAFKKRNAGQITSYAAETEQRRYLYEQRN